MLCMFFRYSYNLDVLYSFYNILILHYLYVFLLYIFYIFFYVVFFFYHTYFSFGIGRCVIFKSVTLFLRLGLHIFLKEVSTVLSNLFWSYLPFYYSSRSLPGSALELRYSHGGGSLPAGSTTHLDPFGNASAGGVVRRSHRARWSSAREDSTKVRLSHPYSPVHS